MNATALIIGAVSLGISFMAGRRLIEGLKTGEMVLFGQFADRGPFDRNKQPARFWLSAAWAGFASMAVLFLLLTLFEGGFE